MVNQSLRDPRLERLARKGGSVEEACVALRSAGASMVQAAKAFYYGRGMSLGDAKSALMSSPAWKREAAASEALHEELFTAIDRGEIS